MPRAEVRLPDWPFGATTRRLLLEALLLDRQPQGGWTKEKLEQRAQVNNGGLDAVLGGAVQLGLVERDGGRWRRGDPLPPIAKPLRSLLKQSRSLPDEEIEPPPKRPYHPRR